MDFAIAALGGALIGLAATLMLFKHGKVAGVSGLIESAATSKVDRAFLIGLFAAGAIFAVVRPSVFGAPSPLSVAGVVVSGLLVGFGTRLSQGCTSGHGVCGLARLSARSLVATLTFMITAGITVWVVRA